MRPLRSGFLLEISAFSLSSMKQVHFKNFRRNCVIFVLHELLLDLTNLLQLLVFAEIGKFYLSDIRWVLCYRRPMHSGLLRMCRRCCLSNGDKLVSRQIYFLIMLICQY